MKKELNNAVQELIGTNERPDSAKNNLPMVIYDGLNKNSKQETLALHSSKETTGDITSTLKPINKDESKDKKPNTKKGLGNFISTNKNYKKGSNGNLPPISEN